MADYELNYDEKKHIQHYESLLQARRDGSRYVNGDQLETARQIADNQRRNAQLRHERIQRLAAEEAAKQAECQVERDQVAQAAQDAYLRQARMRYPGTDADWERDKDEIARQWRIRNALGEGDPNRELLAASDRYMF
jgi:conjugal transfer/entry exclusion protein